MATESLNLDLYRRPPPKGRPNRRKRERIHLALVRAKFRCERCGADERLTIHHLVPKSKQIGDWLVLCVDCHCAEHS